MRFKYSVLLLVLGRAVATTVFSSYRHDGEQKPLNDDVDVDVESLDRFLIELSPGETRWITEDEKWELRRVSLS